MKEQQEILVHIHLQVVKEIIQGQTARAKVVEIKEISAAQLDLLNQVM